MNRKQIQFIIGAFGIMAGLLLVGSQAGAKMLGAGTATRSLHRRWLLLALLRASTQL